MPGLPISRDEVYLKFHDKVSGYIHNRVSNRQDAEDIVSLVFLKVYEKADTFVGEDAGLSTWIYTVTRNTLINYYKKRSVSLAADSATVDEADDSFDKEIELSELADALRLLDEQERDLIILHYHREMTIRQIAGMMGISYTSAKLLHKKALARLREILS